MAKVNETGMPFHRMTAPGLVQRVTMPQGLEGRAGGAIPPSRGFRSRAMMPATRLNLTITPTSAGTGHVDVFSTMGSGSSQVTHYPVGVVGDQRRAPSGSGLQSVLV